VAAEEVAARQQSAVVSAQRDGAETLAGTAGKKPARIAPEPVFFDLEWIMQLRRRRHSRLGGHFKNIHPPMLERRSSEAAIWLGSGKTKILSDFASRPRHAH
jgi:hypothetical protein